MTVRSLRLGLLYPDYSAQDDFQRIGAQVRPPATMELVQVGGDEYGRQNESPSDNGDADSLLTGATTLRERGVDAVMWASTSGSFVRGLGGARAQARAVKELSGAPASSTSLAFAAAAAALGLWRVAVAATYPPDVAAMFSLLLSESGIEVVHTGALGIATRSDARALGRDAVLRLATSSDHASAEAVLLPDTALHTVAWLDDLEAAVGKTVLTANQVTVWQGLQLAGCTVHQEGLGTLFRSGATS
jgi:maleate cis-trans isomerase